ncbi:MAG TPA: acetyl-CoA carboxylase biotin carboxyl carrier protein subunit [Gammaproteobacteria bacterium]|nr:acetyl-CoA carboxylase biotin carboxyl carrier protein subunit [Gammaproteobacteria bacterium]
MPAEVKAAMSGTVWKVLVEPGRHVADGEEVLILESMKMEVPHESPCDGIVKEIVAGPETYVEEGDTLIRIEED